MIKKSFYQKSSRLKLHFIILLIFGISHTTMAQNQNINTDMISYLKTIEDKYHVIFSYADDVLENIYIKPSKKLESLNDELKYLRSQTPFDYLLQDNRQILVVPQSHSKSRCVKVMNSLTNEPVLNSSIAYAGFILKPDDEAKFYLPDDDLLSFKVYAQDYVTKTFKLRPNRSLQCNSVYITPFYQVLDEVVLTNLLTRGIQKISSGALEINYKEFGLLPGLVEPDVLQSLQALPGITSRRESVSYLNVRGGTHDQNLFLWDGIKMYNTSVFFGMISAFNPYITKDVKLIKNGTSAKYGDGVSSLIDMQTSNSIADSLQVGAGINLINADVFLQAPVNKKSSIEISSRHSINSLWESPTYNSYFDKVFQNTEVTNFGSEDNQQDNDFSFFDATLNYKYEISPHDFIKANLFYSEDIFELNRFERHNNQINTRTSDLGQTNLAGGLFYERHWSQSTNSQFQFYTSTYNQNSANTNLLNEQRLEQVNEVQEYGFKLNVQQQLNSNLSNESGYQLNETGILNSQSINDPGFFRETQNSILTHSLYTQFNYKSENDLFIVNVGARLNHFSKFDEYRFEPRFNLSYQFIEDLFLEVLAEEKSQVTSQTIDLQTDFLGVENRRWVLSQPDIRPIIESQQVSAGLNFVKPSWFLNVDLFYKKVDGITAQGQGFQNQFEFSADHGNYEVKGLDILLNKSFDPVSGWLSYSLSENKYNFSNLNPSSFLNNLDLRHVISTGLSYEKNGLKLSAGFNWHSGATTTLPLEEQNALTEQILYDSPNAARLKDYFRFDLSSTYAFPLYRNIKALAGISFLNVFGNTNVYNQFYGIDDSQNIQAFHQNGLGFTPNLVFRIRF